MCIRDRYEPEYIEEHSPKSAMADWQKIRKYTDAFFVHLSRSGLRELIEAGLRQYNKALNTRDPQQCLVQLWSALEILMQSAAGGSKETARRAAFLSKQHEYRRAKLLHIANARNDYVHAGTEIALADMLGDDLKGYVAEIIWHMVFARIKYRDKEQLRQMLDLPTDPVLIRNRIATARTGLKVRQ